jgi:hypothetical protein
MGGFNPGIAKLLEDHEWGLAVQMLLMYLHTINASENRAVQVLTTCWTPLEAPRPCRCQQLHARKEE